MEYPESTRPEVCLLSCFPWMDVEAATTCRGRSRRECFSVAMDYLTEYQRNREIGTKKMVIVNALRLCASMRF
jgi:hypothetical protein